MSAPDCCSEPVVTEQSHANEGEYVEVYGECQTCGAEWTDVFTHTSSHRREDD